MACRFTELVLDCHDHDRMGRFWAEVLGYEVSERSDGPEHFYVELTGPAGSGPSLLLLRTPGDKIVKNRLHIDVNASGGREAPLDLRRERVEAEVRRLVSLGATRLHTVSEEGLDHYAVAMTDPERNEFDIN